MPRVPLQLKRIATWRVQIFNAMLCCLCRVKQFIPSGQGNKNLRIVHMHQLRIRILYIFLSTKPPPHPQAPTLFPLLSSSQHSTTIPNSSPADLVPPPFHLETFSTLQLAPLALVRGRSAKVPPSPCILTQCLGWQDAACAPNRALCGLADTGCATAAICSCSLREPSWTSETVEGVYTRQICPRWTRLKAHSGRRSSLN